MEGKGLSFYQLTPEYYTKPWGKGKHNQFVNPILSNRIVTDQTSSASLQTSLQILNKS